VTLLDELLEDVEETLWAEDMAPLYGFSWFLRGRGQGLTEDDIANVCQQAYDEITNRHALHLEWFEWPAAGTTGRRADPGTPLDFDINTTGTIETPFLALVPDQAVST
jgi:hypothetical protein